MIRIQRQAWLATVVGAAAATGLFGGCTQHRVEVAPIEVRPIHMTVDVNIKIDRELDDFFDFEDRLVSRNGTSVPAVETPQTPIGGVQR